MDIPQTTSATTSPAAATAKSETEKSNTAISGDFETFLKLLTTQMRNQDPLKPMDSTEFVAQLASFSAVEQQIRANDRLDSILGVLSDGSPAGLAQWIDREVQVAAKADFAGAPVEIGVTPVDGADKAVLVVKNDFGQEVARLTVAPDASSLSWDGTDAMGATVAEGRYGFSVESYQGATLLGSQQGKVFATVSEVRIVDGVPVLVTGDGSQVPLDEVAAVR